MEWSTPDALDLWFRLAGESYAIQSEGTACGVLTDAAAGGGTVSVPLVGGTADTFIGGGNLSWQAMEWSTPDALDLWFRLAGESYAIQTEGTACGVLEDAAAVHRGNGGSTGDDVLHLKVADIIDSIGARGNSMPRP